MGLEADQRTVDVEKQCVSLFHDCDKLVLIQTGCKVSGKSGNGQTFAAKIVSGYSYYSEFAAVYGRRRIGKTFLIRETFNYKFTFEHAGVANGDSRTQLRAFRDSLVDAGMSKMRIPTSWMDAFSLLRQLIKESTDKKKVIFIDEIPWMDVPRSNFVSGLLTG